MKQFVGNFFEWLLRASWQAAIIVLLVLAIQWLFRKKLSERWRYALWSLVLFRLLLPTSIPSNLSLYNLTRLAPSSTHAIQPKPITTANITSPAPAPVPEHAITPAMQIEVPAPPPHLEPLAVTPSPKPKLTSFFTTSNLLTAASLIWLAGTLLLLSRILIQNTLFSRRLRHSKTITDTPTLDLFQDCKNLFGITFPIRLLETSAVRSPAIYGFFRPVLLLPSELLSNFTARELRYIFLHELAHVKRRDMAVHWVATLLGLLHWFNPILWFAFRRMAADRELACDELALSHANEQESQPYGETIIKLLESCAQTAALPGLMGILEDKDQMTRRISMIARFKKHSRWSLPAIVLLLLLGIFTLTDAQSPVAPQATDTTSPTVPSGTNIPVASSASSKRFQLIEATTDEPIANARVTFNGGKSSRLKTDTNGVVEIPPGPHGSLGFSMNGATTVPSGKVPTAYALRPLPTLGASTTPSGTNSTPAVSTKNAQLKFQVLDAITGQPVVNAKIRAASFREGGKGTASTLKTDTNGLAFIEILPAPYNGMNIFATADGYVPKCYSPIRFGKVPASYVMRLAPGTAIGGAVLDEQQKPVVGAKIEFQGPGSDAQQMENIQFGPDTATHTDSTGHWICSMMPTNLEQMSFVLTHSNYARLLASISPNTPASTNSVIVMKTSPVVFGTVTDQRGNPIKEATIREVDNSSGPTVSTKSDKDGKFTLKNLMYEELDVVAQADGFAPQLASAIATNTPTEIHFQLAPGNLFRGQVVDESGNPITNAVVQTDWDWGGLRKVEWSTRTDKDGRFEWNSAPAEPLLYWIEASGYAPIRTHAYKADGSDQVLTLHRPKSTTNGAIKIQGSVVDEETGEALNDFKVLFGAWRGSPDVPLEFNFLTDGTSGHFSHTLSSLPYLSQYQIQVRKDGYLPVVSTNLFMSAGNQTLSFKLHKGSGPNGVVLLPDGSPASDATVFLCEGTRGVYMDKPGNFFKNASLANRTVTDATGHFSFAPALAAHTLIAIHDQGYAEIPAVTFYTPGKIVLQPWGRVEGRLFIGNKPGAAETIHLENIHYRRQPDGRVFDALSLWLSATTDADGKFVIEKVPPGERTVSRVLPAPRPGPFYETHGIPINVTAGSTTKVQLGGTGQPVKGKALLPTIDKDIDWRLCTASLTTKISDPLGQPPKREDYASVDELIAAAKKYSDANRAFWSSEQGRALDRARQTFTAALNPDGSFLIPDVPAGTYELKITISESEKNSIRPNSGYLVSKPLATATQEVTVPEVAGGFSEDPLDLGTLKLNGADSKPLKPALKKTQNIQGKVLLPDGTPASRAEVVLGTREHGTVLGDRHFLDRERSVTMDTLSDGSFNLGPAPDAHALFVTHDSGFAQVDLENPIYPLTIKLQPWGRIEGTLFTGGKLVANQKVALFAPFSTPNVGGLGLSRDFFNVEADSQGKFIFEHVPPIEVSVCRMVPCGRYDTYAEPQYVEVQPGTMTNIVHNAVGRIITGQFVTASGNGSLHWTNQNIGFLGKKMDGSVYSRLAASESREWVMYYLDPGGKTSVRTRQQFPIIVNPDGTFKMENVPPGTYNLDITFFEPFKIPVQSLGKQIASLRKEITIPAPETGNPYQEFNLGKLEVELAKNSSYR